MVIGHLTTSIRKFKPLPEGHKAGGARKGKPQNKYPLFILMVADAVTIQLTGSIDAMLANRCWGANEEFYRCRLEEILPGVYEYLEYVMVPTKTSKSLGVKNRVYKMYYNGTSARGDNHDSRTRAAVSNEHWMNKTPKFREIHELITRGKLHVIPNWRSMV